MRKLLAGSEDAPERRSWADVDPQWALAKVWQHRYKVMAWGGLFGLVGVVYALLSPVEFTAEVRLLPELQARSAVNLKRFGALAELAGINLEGVGTTEAIRPDLYPDVLKSTPFALHVLNRGVTTNDKTTYRTLAEYLTGSHRGWLSRWLSDGPVNVPPVGAGKQPLRLNRDQEELIKNFKERVLSDLDKQSGIIIVRVKMPDAEVAAQISQMAIDYLTEYVVDYRTEKTREDLSFLAHRQLEAKKRYNQAMLNLSAYKDQHRFLITQVSTIEGRKLQSEFDLAQNLYDDLTRQYEQTRIKVQEETPILKVLEPPSVPTKRSEPKRTILVLIFTLVGTLAGMAWVLLRHLELNSLLHTHDA